MNSKFLPSYFKGVYGYSLGDFSNISHVTFGAERVGCPASFARFYALLSSRYSL